MREQQECEELGQRDSGSFGVRVKGQTSTGDVVVGVCWGLPGQEKTFPDCFTSTCPGPCERLEPPLDGMKGNTAEHKSSATGADPYSKEDHVRKKKAWGSKQ